MSSRISDTRRGFTMTELMIAIVVLIVVILGTSKIFGTASQITRIGQATSSVMQEAAAIEDQLRRDISRLSYDGFFAIRCVAIRNDVKGNGQPLLNPNLPPTAIIRADQLLFFTDGVDSVQTSRLTSGSNRDGQGTMSRVYWGHAFQLNELGRPAAVDDNNKVRGHDPNVGAGNNPNLWTFITPWTNGPVAMGTFLYSTEGPGGGAGGTGVYGLTGPAVGPALIQLSQPASTRWLLARQAVTLMNDDNGSSESNQKTTCLNGQMATARSIFYSNVFTPGSWGNSRELRNGRLDAAASELDDVRRFVTVLNPVTGVGRPWYDASVPLDQRKVISSALYYPRAERRAPSMNRVDQALTNHVIGSACSSIAIDWTYYDGVGHFDTDGDGIIDLSGGLDLGGIVIPPNAQQPWFGMPDCESPPGPPASFVYPDPHRGTRPLSAQQDYQLIGWPNQMNPPSIYFNNIEGYNSANGSPVTIDVTSGGQARVMHYEAFFGYNQTRPYWNTSVTPPIATSTPYIPNLSSRMAAGYTPWPSAIRVTMTLHDPDGRLEGGREFQFVIDLPKRAH